MQNLLKLVLLATLLSAGCNTTASSRDQFAKRRTVTGSNVPIGRNQLPFSPTGATSPPESLSRDRPSLYPTEPVVGRNTRNQDRGTEPANTGAGPAGGNPVLPLNGNN